VFVHVIDKVEALIVSLSSPGGVAHIEALDRFYQELTRLDRVPGKPWIWVGDRVRLAPETATSFAGLRAGAEFGARVGKYASRLPPLFTVHIQPRRRDRFVSQLFNAFGTLVLDVADTHRNVVVASWANAVRQAETVRAMPLPRLDILRGQLTEQLASAR
jgi:hypothetical protein